MTRIFQTVALIGKPQHAGANTTLARLYDFLKDLGHTVLLQDRVADELPLDGVTALPLHQLAEQADLAIVVGGDGNMLGAARVLSRFDIAVIGVNRGNLGFLTDLTPEGFEVPLKLVLEGQFLRDQRFLLEASIHRHGEVKSLNSAMNEVVLHPGKVAHMIEFEVFIDNQFMLGHRSDGLIVSTPTGSTAYSLSAGGPILTPGLDVINLVPMFPHTLSARPIVVDANSEILLKIAPDNKSDLMISCDGHVNLSILPEDEVLIRKLPHELSLLHPKDHNYFEVLRSKLGWSSRLF